LFAGQKLLVADESPYYQTVLSLTFTDEGMTLAVAGDGREALAKLEQSPPDVIITSVSLPGISGCEICRIVKQDERLAHIPVILLVGLHESFNQAEARRAGADDIVTKPFKSIRQLVNRVGSLLGGKGAEGGKPSTLGLDRAEPAAAIASDNQPAVSDNVPTAEPNNTMAEPNVHVFVEASVLDEHDSVNDTDKPSGHACVADIALQTADTQKLERIDDEPESEKPIEYAQANTMELPAVIAVEPIIEPAIHQAPAATVSEDSGPLIETSPSVETESANVTDEAVPAPAVQTSIMDTREMNEISSPHATPTSAPIFDDSLLDLGDFETAPPGAPADDLVLDLDYEAQPAGSAFARTESLSEPVAPVSVPVKIMDEPPVVAEPAVAAEELHQWTTVAEQAPTVSPPAEVPLDPASGDPAQGLSPEAVDAIARRVVEQLSEKVVREIAWEVVPELAELLIKKKLEEKK
jgi:CheY-like chemotaxis protein